MLKMANYDEEPNPPISLDDSKLDMEQPLSIEDTRANLLVLPPDPNDTSLGAELLDEIAPAHREFAKFDGLQPYRGLNWLQRLAKFIFRIP